MFCAEWSIVKIQFQTATVLPLKCKCWTCDECRPGRTKRLVEEAKSGKPDVFITLTSKRRASLTADQAAVLLAHAWRHIRAEYLRAHGKHSLPFLAVFEETKRGWPHIHIVARCKWIDQRWLSKRMKALHDSPVVHVRRVTGVEKVAYYISKYISKNPHRFEGVKRYWRSLDYLFPVAAEEPDEWGEVPHWEVVRRHYTCIADDMARDGWLIKGPYARAPPELELAA